MMRKKRIWRKGYYRIKERITTTVRKNAEIIWIIATNFDKI